MVWMVGDKDHCLNGHRLVPVVWGDSAAVPGQKLWCGARPGPGEEPGAGEAGGVECGSMSDPAKSLTHELSVFPVAVETGLRSWR